MLNVLLTSTMSDAEGVWFMLMSPIVGAATLGVSVCPGVPNWLCEWAFVIEESRFFEGIRCPWTKSMDGKPDGRARKDGRAGVVSGCRSEPTALPGDAPFSSS